MKHLTSVFSWCTGLFLLLFPVVSHAQTASLTEDEQALYELVMAYRAEYGLPRIPVSPSLTYVAHVHAQDVYYHYSEFPAGCNNHSWSSHGTWTRCDYYGDHRNAEGMWSKPRELTSYPGNGYEIIHYFCPPTSGICTPEGALKSWQSSPGHNAVVINQSIWEKHPWAAIGIGMYKGVACIWFGEQTDPATEGEK